MIIISIVLVLSISINLHTVSKVKEYEEYINVELNLAVVQLGDGLTCTSKLLNHIISKGYIGKTEFSLLMQTVKSFDNGLYDLSSVYKALNDEYHFNSFSIDYLYELEELTFNLKNYELTNYDLEELKAIEELIKECHDTLKANIKRYDIIEFEVDIDNDNVIGFNLKYPDGYEDAAYNNVKIQDENWKRVIVGINRILEKKLNN